MGLGGGLGLGGLWGLGLGHSGLLRGVGAHLDRRARVCGAGDDRDVAEGGDLVHVTDVSLPRVARDAHPPRAGAKVASLDRLDHVLAARRRVDRPVRAVCALLDREGGREPPERQAAVLDGRDELGEVGAAERARLDHLAESAEVSTTRR